MNRRISELLALRGRSRAQSSTRLLAEHCLELCFHELAANDEGLRTPACDVRREIADVLRGRVWAPQTDRA